MCKHSTDSLEEVGLKELFEGITKLYFSFQDLSKQYSLRLITILTRQWNDKKIEEYLIQIVRIIAMFISSCDSPKEMKLVTLNLERISCFKKLLKIIAEDEKIQLLDSISSFISKHLEKEEYAALIEQLLKFCKKLSKYSQSHKKILDNRIDELGLRYISRGKYREMSDAFSAEAP